MGQGQMEEALSAHAPVTARDAIAVTSAEQMPRPGVTRLEAAVHLAVGIFGGLVLLALAVGVAVTS